MFQHLNKLLERILPAGIPKYLLDYHMWMLFKKYEGFIDNSPKVLTINDLCFGFVLWLGACGLSIVAFMLEIVRFKLRKIFRILIGLTMFLRILIVRLKVVVV